MSGSRDSARPTAGRLARGCRARAAPPPFAAFLCRSLARRLVSRASWARPRPLTSQPASAAALDLTRVPRRAGRPPDGGRRAGRARASDRAHEAREKVRGPGTRAHSQDGCVSPAGRGLQRFRQARPSLAPRALETGSRRAPGSGASLQRPARGDRAAGRQGNGLRLGRRDSQAAAAAGGGARAGHGRAGRPGRRGQGRRPARGGGRGALGIAAPVPWRGGGGRCSGGGTRLARGGCRTPLQGACRRALQALASKRGKRSYFFPSNRALCHKGFLQHALQHLAI